MCIINKFLNKWKSLSLPVRASVCFMVCSFLQRGISVITTPVFTRLLSTKEYGVYSVFTSWLNVITVFATLQLYYGVYMQGLVKYEHDRDKFSSSMQGLMTTVWLLFLGIYLCFHTFWNRLLNQPTELVIAMFIMMWETGTFSFWSARQRVDYKYRLLTQITLLVSAMKPLLGIIAIFLFPLHRVEARVWSLVVVEVAAYSGFYFSQMLKGKKFFDKFYWKYGLEFNIPLIPHYLSQIVLGQCDRIMIERMINPQSAGIYSLAYSVSQIMLIFNTAVNNSFSPWLYKSIKNKKFKDIAPISYMILVFIALINLVLILMAPEIILVFAPSQYYEAVYIVPPVTMSVYFTFMYTLFANFEFYYEKTKFITLASVIGALINIGLNYLLIPLFGYISAGYTTLACYIIYCIGHYIFMRKVCNTELHNKKIYDTKIILLISLLFLMMGLLMIPLYEHLLIRYLLVIAVVMIAVSKRKKILSLYHFIRN